MDGDGRSRVYGHWKQELKGALPAPAHRYEEIPRGVDILMSHMAPRDIFDHIMEGTWGSSQQLTQRIWAVKPKAHLFGHIHEGRRLARPPLLQPFNTVLDIL